MRALVDTHILLWWLGDDARLDSSYRELISNSDNELFVSSVTIAEISIKASLGKLTVPHDIVQTAASEGFASLPFTAAHAEVLRDLPWHHRDAFGRMLVAQSMAERMPFATADLRIREYDVDCL
ncbi:MAG: type II toxin-antitoxin system VapC family toxin [Microbacteriaceae bacterium]|nr:MAG: type II toxin-antitoxin system VapC family toxin [Microbacteriaceae bacterium]